MLRLLLLAALFSQNLQTFISHSKVCNTEAIKWKEITMRTADHERRKRLYDKELLRSCNYCFRNIKYILWFFKITLKLE